MVNYEAMSISSFIIVVDMIIFTSITISGHDLMEENTLYQERINFSEIAVLFFVHRLLFVTIH
jgi:hypothetical protein